MILFLLDAYTVAVICNKTEGGALKGGLIGCMEYEILVFAVGEYHSVTAVAVKKGLKMLKLHAELAVFEFDYTFRVFAVNKR